MSARFISVLGAIAATRRLLAAAVSVAVAACSHAPPASVPPWASPLPHPESQVIHATFPAGSTLRRSDIPPSPGEQPEAETCIVPLAVADEIADLRVLLPIGMPFGDGRPWCGEDPLAAPGSIQWSSGTPQTEPLRGKFLGLRHARRLEDERSQHHPPANES
jgi:hypothetical protein